MVPPASHRISRVLRYSGTGWLSSGFAYGSFTLFGGAFQRASATLPQCLVAGPQPQRACSLVWPVSLSLATTQEIDVSFFSSGYLDVSVPRVPFSETMDSSQDDWTLLQPGFPIRTSTDQCLLAAPRSLSQLATSFFGVWCLGIRPVLLFA